jgi:hypothetical protein
MSWSVELTARSKIRARFSECEGEHVPIFPVIASVIGIAVSLIAAEAANTKAAKAGSAAKKAEADAARERQRAAERGKEAARAAERAKQAERDAERAARERDAAERERDRPQGPSKDKLPDHPVALEDKPAEPGKPEDKPRGARAAAQALYDYVTAAIRSGRGATLGDKSGPNAFVRDAQRDMGRLTTDGIYGPKTRARGKELLGREFPAREGATRVPARAPVPAPSAPSAPKPETLLTSRAPSASAPSKPSAAPPKASSPAPSKPSAAPPKASPPAPSKPSAAPPKASPPAPSKPSAPSARTAMQAATELRAYAVDVLGRGQGALLGTKAKPSEVVRDAQRDMGQLTTDGIYGPKTRERGKALTGQSFPART